MKKRALFISLFMAAVCTAAFVAADGGWKSLSDGVGYRKIEFKRPDIEGKTIDIGAIHFFKISPAKLKLQVVTAKALGLTSLDAQSYAQKSGALISINGGFFTPEYASLGLIVKDGKELSKLKWTGWWHVFQMNRGKPSIIEKKAYQLRPEIEMAIEAGPRLLIDGTIPAGLKPASSERTALGISSDGDIIIAVTQNNPMSMEAFAKRMLEVGCYNALNLDGGSSTQIFAKIGGFELRKAGFNTVANAVVVLPR